MKYQETHFEEYIQTNNKHDLHPKLDKIYNKFPKELNKMKNIIFYGPAGTGKYTQALKVIKKYSPSELKYEKKIIITFNKKQYFFKISDIHYEIDMSMLGCNSKLLWHDIFQQIIDSISAKPDKSGIILCKYFHDIHNELLDNFYSYMQKNSFNNIDLKYFIITEQISFIPDSIINCSQIINISRPTKNSYNKIIKNKLDTKMNIEDITNIKTYKSNTISNKSVELMTNYKIICSKIINTLINVEDIKFLKFRDNIYDILICNLNINDCIWFILSNLMNLNKIKKENLPDVLIKTYNFFQYYNNNYRPIYHLENYFLYLACIIHNYNVLI